jgi:hypothetical protein
MQNKQLGLKPMKVVMVKQAVGWDRMNGLRWAGHVQQQGDHLQNGS